MLAALLSATESQAYAQSSVTLYGIADASVQYTNNVNVAESTGSKGHPIVYKNGSRVGMYSGGGLPDRWGLKGNEDLGGGLAAFFTLENGFNIGTGAAVSSTVEFNRQAFVGISSPYGSVSFGRQYEAITDLLEIYGPIAYAGGLGTFAGDVTNFDNNIRMNNSVKYKTPNIHGFTGEVVYGMGGVAGSLGTNSAVSAGVNYVQGGLAAGVAYLRMDNSASTANTWASSADSLFTSSVNTGFAGARSAQIVDATIRYDFGKFAVNADYGWVQYRPSSVSLFSHSEAFSAAGIGAQYWISPALRVGAAYTYTRGQSVDGSAASPQYQSVAFRTYYSLSKTTTLYFLAGYSHAKGSTLDAYGNVIAATATIGDSGNFGSNSASNSQFLARVGVMKLF